MTPVMTATATTPRKTWWRHGISLLTPDMLLFTRYKLTRKQKLIMLLWGIVLSQVASPIGDAIYYLFTQVSYGTQNAGAPWFTWFSLKDPWDRLPVHVQNLVHARWFSSQTAPAWWVTARHDARHVLIGMLVMMMIGLLKVGMSRKPRRRVHPFFIFTAPVWVLLAAAPAAALGIVLVSKVAPVVMHIGLMSGNPWVSEWLGKGSWQLTLIGLLAGFGASKVYNPIADTVQLMSLEKKLYNKDTPKWWWRFVYLPNYRNRYEYLVASGNSGRLHGKVMGTIMMIAAPVFIIFLAYGVWLKYASHILPH